MDAEGLAVDVDGAALAVERLAEHVTTAVGRLTAAVGRLPQHSQLVYARQVDGRTVNLLKKVEGLFSLRKRC